MHLIPVPNISHGCCTAHEILESTPKQFLNRKNASQHRRLLTECDTVALEVGLLESALVPCCSHLPRSGVGERKKILRGGLENWLRNAARSSLAGAKLLAAFLSIQSDTPTLSRDHRPCCIATAGPSSRPTPSSKPEPHRPDLNPPGRDPQTGGPGPRPSSQPPQSPPPPPPPSLST